MLSTAVFFNSLLDPLTKKFFATQQPLGPLLKIFLHPLPPHPTFTKKFFFKHHPHPHKWPIIHACTITNDPNSELLLQRRATWPNPTKPNKQKTTNCDSIPTFFWHFHLLFLCLYQHPLAWHFYFPEISKSGAQVCDMQFMLVVFSIAKVHKTWTKQSLFSHFIT